MQVEVSTRTEATPPQVPGNRETGANTDTVSRKPPGGAGSGADAVATQPGPLPTVVRRLPEPMRKIVGGLEKAGEKGGTAGLWLSGKAAKVSKVLDKALSMGGHVSGVLGKLEHGAAHAAASLESIAQEDVDAIVDADAERDRQRDEVEKVGAHAGPRGRTEHPQHASDEAS